ncbi:MAG: T9SS type A sorting domain-containing protein [Saprospiraceae bacterium]|nr:T9SS type A sorting domain-containing protein [Saprospiraceae bacterium]
MIKNILFVLICFFGILSVNGQSKKYIFMEHFTNTYCGVCGAVNPGFYNLIKKYEGNYHHMTVHPRFPYPQCSLYQANTSENTARASYYSVTSTPTVVINGTRKMAASNVNANILDGELNKQSAVAIVVKESGGSSRTVQVEVKTLGNKPAGNYRLFAAAAEKVLNLNTPNGEKVHHNVFRKFISAPDGNMIQIPESGNSLVLDFNFNVEPNWKESEIYLLVWIQETTTKDILNSGTKFDEDLSGSHQIKSIDFKVMTNPVKSNLVVQMEKGLTGDYAIMNIMGQMVDRGAVNPFTQTLDIDVSDYKKGIYLVRIQSGGQKLTKRWVKD